MPLAEGITSGVIGHVLVGLLTQIFSKDTDVAKILGRIERALATNPEVSQILQEAAASTARFAKLGRGTPERVRSFLVSPEVESMLRQVFSTQLLKGESRHIVNLRSEFHASLALHLGSDGGVPNDLSDALFDTLLASCSRALDAALNRGSISALAAKVTSDNRLLLAEIAGISANLSFLRETSGLQPNKINEFEKTFRKQVAKAHQYIVPHDLDSAKRVAIDKLYVPSDLVRVDQKETAGVTPSLGARDFMSASHRSVILGNPGGGKSTFATKLCHDVATHYPDRLFAGRLLTPVFVTLREYGIQKKSRGHSIVQFIESIAISDYQAIVPPGAFNYLLLNGRLMVIFDGLDELLETSDRQRIRSDVELFAEWYPSTPILVTSREVGYEQAPLDERFETFKLSSFSDDQVKQYASKWFCLNTDLPPAKQKQLAGSFFEESKLVPDIRSNPLMLALICNIYNVEGYIPRNRPEVYRKCAEMLFDKWDKRRGIHYALPFEAYVRPAMHDLAYWIYSDESLQGGVAEELLIGRASQYLKEWCFESLEEAKSAATKFIEFCRGRAWVLSDTGTKEGGEKLYQFTHRTFLEYFTAEELAHTCRLPADLAGALHPHIAKREWDIVCQLAYQLKGKNSPSNTNELFRDLLERAASSVGDGRWNYLSFAARCLEFMVPSPQVRRALALECLRCCIEWASKSDGGENGKTEAPRSRQLISNLLNAARENRGTIVEVVGEVLLDEIKVGPPEHQDVCADLVLNLSYAAQLGSSSSIPEDIVETWQAVTNTTIKGCATELDTISRRSLTVCADMLYRGLSVQQLTERYGVPALFKGRPSAILQIRYSSIVESALRAILQSAAKGEFKAFVSARAREISKILVNAPAPWVLDHEELKTLYPSWIVVADMHAVAGSTAAAIDGDLLFAALAIICVFIEVDKTFLWALFNSKNSLLRICRSWLGNPLKESGIPKSPQLLKQPRLSAEQQTVISDWLHGKIEFVRGSGHAGRVFGGTDLLHTDSDSPSATVNS